MISGSGCRDRRGDALRVRWFAGAPIIRITWRRVGRVASRAGGSGPGRGL